MSGAVKSPSTGGSARSSPKSSSPNHSSASTSPSTSASSSPKAASSAPTANGDDALARAEKEKAAGTARYTAGAFDDAIQLYSSAISLLPANAPANTRASLHSNRSACYLMLQQYQPALDDSLAAIQCDPAFSKAYARASKCYLAMGQYDRARDMLRASKESGTAVDMANIDKYDKMQQKAAELVTTNPQLALAFLSQLLTHTPANTKAHILHVNALLNTNQVDKAKQAADTLFRADSRNTDVLYVRGLCMYRLGNLDMALKHMQSVLSSDPDYAAAGRLFKQIRAIEAKKQEGNTLFTTEGKAAEAVEKYTEALAMDPSNTAVAAVLLANRAAAHIKLKQWDKAIDDCDKSLEYKADNAKVLLRRSQCRRERKEWEECVRDIEAALKVESDSDDIKRQLREAKLELKKSKRKDYYAILGMDKSSFSETELKKAYRRAALQWHPDKNNQTEEKRADAEKKFKDITEAYETLNDDNKRRRYDSGVDLDDDGGMGGGGGMPGGIDPSELFSMFFGAGGGGMGGMGGGGMPRGMGGMGGMGGRRPGGHGHAHGPGGFQH